MVKIFYGVSGTKKTEVLIKNVNDGAKECRRQIFIVPETKTYETEKSLLESLPNGGSEYVEVYSLSRLGVRILEQNGINMDDFIDDAGRLILAKKAIGMAETAFKYYKKGTSKGEFAVKILGVFDELRASGVTAKSLYSAYENGDIGDNVYDIATAFTVYCDLIKESKPDKREILSFACECGGASEFFNDADVYFDNFSGFTHFELEMVTSALKGAFCVTFAIMCKKNEYIFAEQNKTLREIVNICKDNGKQCTLTECTDNVQRPLDLRFCSENLYAFEHPVWGNKSENVELISAMSPYDECLYVASKIHDATTVQRLRYDDIKIVVSTLDKYEKILANAFKKFDIPLYISDKSDILTKPIISACVGALYVINSNFAYNEMFSFLKTGLFNITDEQCDILENYVLAWNIRGSQWQREWQRNPNGYGERDTEYTQKLLAELNTCRKRIIEPILKLKEGFSRAQYCEEYCDRFLEYIEHIDIESEIDKKIEQLNIQNNFAEAAEYGQLYDIFTGAIEQLKNTMNGEQISEKEFIKFVCLILSQYSIATIPATLDRIVVSDFRAFTSIKPKILFIMGAADGELPPVTSSENIISENERERLSMHDIKLSLSKEEMETELESHIYRAFSAPLEKLYVSYPQSGSTGEECLPSYLFVKLDNMLEKNDIIDTQSLGDAYLMSSKQAVFELACRYISGDKTPATLGAFKYFENDTMAQEQFELLRRIKESKRGPLKNKELIKKMYGDNIKLSASRIEKINSCKFSYFLQYGLRAKPRKPLSFDSRAVGSFLHKIVEEVIKKYSTNSEIDIKETIKNCAVQYIENNIAKNAELSGKLTVMLTKLVNNAFTIVNGIIDEIEHSDFKPAFCEFSFGRGGDAPPYSFSAGNVSVEIDGVIDRIDTYAKNGRLYLKVVDYKSGKKSFNLSDVLYGINVQMFLYLLMLKECGEDTFKNLNDGQARDLQIAAALYVPISSNFEDTKNGAFDDSDDGQKVRRIGYILEDLDMANALEHTDSGKFEYLPISIKKDETFSATSSVMNAEQFGKVFKKIKKNLMDIADAVMGGDIDTTPYRTGLDWSFCDWCDFHMACAFDESMKYDNMKTLKKLKKDEVFLKLSEEEL